MNKITERYRYKIRVLTQQVDALGTQVELSRLQWLSPEADDVIREVYASLHHIATKLTKLEGDPPRERVVDSEDMVCPICQKPLTNPDDPCDCPAPPQDLEDAVTDVLLAHGVASKPLTQDILVAVRKEALNG